MEGVEGVEDSAGVATRACMKSRFIQDTVRFSVSKRIVVATRLRVLASLETDNFNVLERQQR